MRMLCIFDFIVQKYNIDYWIFGGILFGVVRYYGFILWDYDIDIEMFLEEYVKFF